jgi:hypothetical protein
VSMLFLPLLQTFAVAVFVMTLSPIILGVSQEASWQLPWVLAGHDWWAAVKFLIIMLVIAVVFAMLPIIGRLQSFNLLILGSISLAVVLALIDRDNDGYVTAHVRFWPGFWFALGLFVVGATLAWVGMLASAMTGAWIDERWEGSGLLVAMPIGSVFGFLPLFIYGAWIAAQLHGR